MAIGSTETSFVAKLNSIVTAVDNQQILPLQPVERIVLRCISDRQLAPRYRANVELDNFLSHKPFRESVSSSHQVPPNTCCGAAGRS